MHMMNDTDRKLLKDCVKLAKDECACCQDGICLKNNLPCTQTLINKNFTLEAGALNCDEFINGVLPADRELHEAVMNRLSEVRNLWDNSVEVSANMFLCTDCGQPFCRRSNSQKRCMYCAARRREEVNRSSHRYRYWLQTQQ